MRRRAVLAALLAAARPARADPVPFRRGSWQALLARGQGRFVVHFWGLTCGPCLAELPEWGRFLTADPGARLVMVAADPVPQPDDQLAATLTRCGLAAADQWRFDGGFAERLYFEVDPEWQGELPRTDLVAGGKSVDNWLGETDFARLRAWFEAGP